MKIVIILVLLGLATSATVSIGTCSCDKATNQTDCQALVGNCFWTDTACRTATCADIKGTPSVTNCNKYGCVFKGNACVAFTQCSDYTVTDATQCSNNYYSGSTSCVAGTQASGSYPCVNAPAVQAPNCPSATNNGSCKNLSNSAGNCGWNGTTCVAYTPTKCSDYTPYGSEYCSSRCRWDGTACVDRTCATQTTCVPFLNFSRTQAIICGGSPCTDVEVSTLSAANCASQTYGAAIFNSAGVCTICHASILFATFILALLF